MIDLDEDNSILVMYVVSGVMESRVMRIDMKRLARDENGRALSLILLLLGCGGLILTPLLSLMSTGLTSGTIYERKMRELYAADAGVELGAWTVLYEGRTSVDDFESNSCDVTVYIQEIPWDDISQDTKDAFGLLEGDRVYFIEATATSAEGGSTVLECHFVITYTSPCEEEGYEDYSGSGNIEGGKVVVEKGDTVTGNILGGASVWNEGGFTCEGNIEGGSTVNIVGDAVFSGEGNVIEESRLFVFGDCTINANIQTGAVIYVSGNLSLSGDIQDEAIVYVGGNLDMDGSIQSCSEPSVVGVGGDLDVGGSIECDVYVDGTVTLGGSWSCGAQQLPFEDFPSNIRSDPDKLNNLQCPLALKSPSIVALGIV